MQYADDVLQSCTLETRMVLLTSVTLNNSIKKKAIITDQRLGPGRHIGSMLGKRSQNLR